MIRLSISAAAADGAFTPVEREAILAHARQAGAEALIAPDLARPGSAGDILRGVSGDFQKQQLYAIAFAIVRADETVTDGERMYLQQVAARSASTSPR